MRIPRLGMRRKGERGQSMVEYVLIVVLVVLVAMGVMKAFGTQIRGLFKKATTDITRDTGVKPDK